MKKSFSVIFIFIAFIFTLGIFGSFTFKAKAFAQEKNEMGFSTLSKSSILLDYNSGKVIFNNNEVEHLPIASMCKIMTLLLCFESIDEGNLNFDEQIKISHNASSMGGSQVFLEKNAEYKVSDLIKSITIASANDSCVAMAERICGSESSFIDKMNERAKELGMDNTCFVNCTGLPKPGQYSCAKDVAKMFSELLNHKEYFEFSGIWMDEISHPEGRVTAMSNTNKLIRFYEGCDSGKTGYTNEAGHCLAASAKRDGMRLICVVISSPDSKTRFKEVSSMFNYGFSNFTNKLIVDAEMPLDINVSVEKGKKDSIAVNAERSIYLFAGKNDKTSIEIDFKPNQKIVAPILKGDVVGKLFIYEKGIEIDCVDVIASEDILQKTYFDFIKDIGSNWSLI